MDKDRVFKLLELAKKHIFIYKETGDRNSLDNACYLLDDIEKEVKGENIDIEEEDIIDPLPW